MRTHFTAPVVVFMLLIAGNLIAPAAVADGAPRAVALAEITISRSAVTSEGQCQPPSLANCFTEATMQQYADTVLPMVVKFFQASYRAMPPPKQYVYIPAGQQVQSACSGVADGMSYAYCPADQNVYVGQEMLWKLYLDGDIGPAIGLAHEMGHNVQTYAGVPQGNTPAESVRYEDQADCVAGAWLQFAGQQGWLEPEDSKSAANVLIDIASDAEPNRDHGDLEERSQSMALGLQGGLPACNQFYPTTPIITSG